MVTSGGETVIRRDMRGRWFKDQDKTSFVHIIEDDGQVLTGYIWYRDEKFSQRLKFFPSFHVWQPFDEQLYRSLNGIHPHVHF